MTVLRAFIITTISSVAFAVAGGVLGYAIGVFAPDYYRIVFRIPPGVELEPVHAGVGLGLTQGLGTGLVVGLIIVAIVAWYNARLRQRST